LLVEFADQVVGGVVLEMFLLGGRQKQAHGLDQVPIFVGRRDELLTKSLYQYLVFLAAPRIVQQVPSWSFAV
jgi:hypothetical protein